MDELNGKARVLNCLLSGGKWQTPKIAEAAGLQANTTIKWLNELRNKDGYKIDNQRVAGKMYDEYWINRDWLKDKKKLEEADAIVRTYDLARDDMPEKIKVLKWYNDLKLKMEGK